MDHLWNYNRPWCKTPPTDVEGSSSSAFDEFHPFIRQQMEILRQIQEDNARKKHSSRRESSLDVLKEMADDPSLSKFDRKPPSERTRRIKRLSQPPRPPPSASEPDLVENWSNTDVIEEQRRIFEEIKRARQVESRSERSSNNSSVWMETPAVNLTVERASTMLQQRELRLSVRSIGRDQLVQRVTPRASEVPPFVNVEGSIQPRRASRVARNREVPFQGSNERAHALLAEDAPIVVSVEEIPPRRASRAARDQACPARRYSSIPQSQYPVGDTAYNVPPIHSGERRRATLSSCMEVRRMHPRVNAPAPAPTEYNPGVCSDEPRVERLGSEVIKITSKSESLKAIHRGESVMVQCPACTTKMHVPAFAGNVFCTACEAISPVAETRVRSSGRQRRRHNDSVPRVVSRDAAARGPFS